MIVAFILLASVFLIIMLTFQPTILIYIRYLSIPLICLIFIICLIIYSNTAVKSALNGLSLWASVVVPSLFPFFVASEIMNSSGFTKAAGSLLEPLMRPLFNVPGCASFALALGVTSGYPVGAKITTDMRKSGSLTKHEAERLLAFTNNSGPLFIIGAVGTGMLGSPVIGLFLFICHLISCITVGFIFRYYKQNSSQVTKKRSSLMQYNTNKKRLSDIKNQMLTTNYTKINFGSLLGNAIKSSVSTILTIGGFIVLFSVIIALMNETGTIDSMSEAISHLLKQIIPADTIKNLVSGILSGMFEITTGSGLISQGTSEPLALKLPAISFLIGWAGLSVHSQVMSIVSETDINIRPYLAGKFIQGILAALYTRIGILLLDTTSLSAAPAMAIPITTTIAFNFNGFFAILSNTSLLLILLITAWLSINNSSTNSSTSKSH